MTGDVARSTGNLTLAMEYIGDTEMRRAREYTQVRPDHLKDAASAMDRDRPNLTQSVPEPRIPVEPGPEVVTVGGGPELPRQDSNLRPVDTEPARRVLGNRKLSVWRLGNPDWHRARRRLGCHRGTRAP